MASRSLLLGCRGRVDERLRPRCDTVHTARTRLDHRPERFARPRLGERRHGLGGYAKSGREARTGHAGQKRISE